MSINNCTQAAKDNDFASLVDAYNSGCLPDGDTIYYAVKSGNIQMLDFLYQRGCKPNVHCGYVAASKGNIMVLEWLFEKGCHLHYDTAVSAVSAVIAYNRETNDNWQEKTLIVLEWLKSKNVDCASPIVVKYAACVSNILALDWIKGNYNNVDYSYAKREVGKGAKGAKGAEWLDKNT